MTMTLLDRVKRLNIFARLSELERVEKERDEALELMLVHLEAVQVSLENRIKTTESQSTRIEAVVGYNLDIKNDLDVA